MNLVPTPEQQSAFDARCGKIEVRGEGPILLTISAPHYSRATGEPLCMIPTLKRRFPDSYAAQQYVAQLKDEGRADDLSFEYTPDVAPSVLAVIERTAA